MAITGMPPSIAGMSLDWKSTTSKLSFHDRSLACCLAPSLKSNGHCAALSWSSAATHVIVDWHNAIKAPFG